MKNPKELIIVTGANSELAQPFIYHFKQRTTTKIIALFKCKNIAPSKSIIPLQCDLEDKFTTKNKIQQILKNKERTELNKIYLLHMIGGFKYEGIEQNLEIDDDKDGIDDEIYISNITTFNNIFEGIIENTKKNIEINLFNIGSKRDFDPNIVPWKSYAKVKNILRKDFQKLSKNYDNINALFVNASTIDISKERKLRPFGEYEYRLSINEIFEKSINELEQIKGYKEIEIYKYHPKYEIEFKQESLEDTHNRWMKEMGKTNM